MGNTDTVVRKSYFRFNKMSPRMKKDNMLCEKYEYLLWI